MPEIFVKSINERDEGLAVVFEGTFIKLHPEVSSYGYRHPKRMWRVADLLEIKYRDTLTKKHSYWTVTRERGVLVFEADCDPAINHGWPIKLIIPVKELQDAWNSVQHMALRN